VEPNEIATLVDELEDRVDRLRAIYEQYFMGIERLEPLILRKDVDRRVWILRREQIRNTALRFKLQNAIQRYNTFQQYWQRICREIENGTYARDVSRAAERFGDAALTAMGRRRQKMFAKGVAKQTERDAARGHGADKAAEPAPAPAAQPRPSESLDDLSSFAAEAIEALELDVRGEFGAAHPRGALTPIPSPPRPASEARHKPPPAPAPPAPSPRPPSSASPPRPLVPSGRSAPPPVPSHPPAPPARPASEADELPIARLREIYGDYVDARRLCHESTAAITFEKLQANLRQTARQLRDKLKAKHVDFEVVIKNGTAILKPVVRR
jgi:hypothetical protein